MPKSSTSKPAAAKVAQKARNGRQRPSRKAKTGPDSTPTHRRPAGRKAAGGKAVPVPPPIRPGTKLSTLVGLLDRKNGATVGELQEATGWQAHSVRGAISGALKKKLGFDIASQQEDGRGRVYRIVGRPDEWGSHGKA